MNTLRITKRVLLAAVVLLVFMFSLRTIAQEFRLSTNCLVSFATVESARRILTNRDDFTSAQSAFDRSARMKTNRDVGEAGYLEFVGRSPQPWSPEETNRLSAVLETLHKRIAPWNPPLPSTLTLIKTSGLEEGNASYTRQNAIILSQRELLADTPALEDLVTHELFHVISRHNPELRKRLYQILGFTRINEIAYPEDLRARRITNPDGVQIGWAINITNRNQTLSAVPVLYSSAARYDLQKGGEFFDYLVFKLLAVTNSPGGWQPIIADGKPYVLEPDEADGFFDQIGKNTDYIIHPDEILAVNFVNLVRGNTNLATPRIVSEMDRVFRQR